MFIIFFFLIEYTACAKSLEIQESLVLDLKILMYRNANEIEKLKKIKEDSDREAAEAFPHKRRLKCDTKHQSQEADATFITSDGSKPYKPWRTLDTDNDNN